jgi:hypothetical protein
MHQGGLDTENIFLQGDGSSVFWTGMNDEQIKVRVERAFKALAGLDYVKNIYFYLPDEASGTRLKKSGEIAAKIRELGGKTWGAANHHWFKTGGTFFDHVNVAGPYVKSDTIAAAQKINCKVFSYNNPQGGVEDPGRFRKNFGLYLWCKGFDGGMTWAWNWGFGDSWNDFDQGFWRDHNMVYPSKTGVVLTIQAAGYMQGVNDTRYLGTLLNLLGRVPANSPEVQKIKSYLKQLHDNEPLYLKDLDKVRDNLIKGIETCKKILK